MLRDTLVIMGTLAAIVAGQWAGIGKDLLNDHQVLWINNTYALLCCGLTLVMGRWIARVTIGIIWNCLTPINYATKWESIFIEWLAFGVGSFVLLLNYTALPVGDVATAAVFVLLACTPALLGAYILSKTPHADAEPDPEEARIARPYLAAFAATVTGLSLNALPFLAVAILFGSIDPASDLTADMLQSVLRAMPVMVLGGTMLQPFLIPVGLKCLSVAKYRLSGQRWEAVLAYAIPVCGLFWSALVFAALTGTAIGLAAFAAVAVGFSSVMAALVYLQLLYGRGPVFVDPDVTFD